MGLYSKPYKTNQMLFTRKRILRLNNGVMTPSEFVKYLGVTLDRILT